MDTELLIYFAFAWTINGQKKMTLFLLVMFSRNAQMHNISISFIRIFRPIFCYLIILKGYDTRTYERSEKRGTFFIIITSFFLRSLVSYYVFSV